MGAKNPERDRLTLDDDKTLLEWLETRPEWAALADCTGCNWSWMVFVQDWIRCRNPPHRVRDLKIRLKCEKCGSAANELHPRFVGLRR